MYELLWPPPWHLNVLPCKPYALECRHAVTFHVLYIYCPFSVESLSLWWLSLNEKMNNWVPVIAPFFPQKREEGWWLVIGEQKTNRSELENSFYFCLVISVVLHQLLKALKCNQEIFYQTDTCLTCLRLNILWPLREPLFEGGGGFEFYVLLITFGIGWQLPLESVLIPLPRVMINSGYFFI